MKKTRLFFIFLVALLFLGGFSAFAQEPAETEGKVLRANLVGRVLDAQGNPVEGVEISAQDPDGEVIARETTNDEGRYRMKCLPVGQYDLTLDPLTTGFQGQTVEADNGIRGLIVDWTVSPAVPAVAVARSGGGPCGAYVWWGTPAAVVGGAFIAGGATFGGLELSGFFDGSTGGNTPLAPPVSPSE